jgi:hypothetical protein
VDTLRPAALDQDMHIDYGCCDIAVAESSRRDLEVLLVFEQVDRNRMT